MYSSQAFNRFLSQVVAKYLSSAQPYSVGGLPFQSHRLLVPHFAAGMAPDDLPPHMKNGARDYLVVPNHLLDLGDTACSKIGSYFRAFWNQDDRCLQQVGSCLEYQPLDMWSQDNEARVQGQRGEYLLEGFATPMDEPIVVNERTGRRYLALRYAGQHLSMAFLEISADRFKLRSSAARQSLSEVTTTAVTNPVLIRLYATNKGHRPALVKASIRGCSFGFGSASTDLVPLSPGEKRLMLLSLRLNGTMPTADVWCTVALEGDGRHVITSRSVLIRPKGRCLCYLHCQCTCLGEQVACKVDGVEDRDKRSDNSHTKPAAAAVQQTTPPTTTSSHHYVIPEPLFSAPAIEDTADPVSCGLSITVVILEVLLSMGLLKAVLGLASPPVARWGLRSYISLLEQPNDTDPNASLTYNVDDKKAVGPGSLFCMNLFCFCILPFILCRGRRKEFRQSQREELEAKIFGFDAMGQDTP
ncbi:hypothetical protein V5799_033489 [Amblyomma americanum]|uniref:Generative cell specific-1/HAP2 domain-containing protein n=1 Tax=Amblyomma americanum TaxID=6943 RepID=A0AAQ4DN61_AMBAM